MKLYKFIISAAVCCMGTLATGCSDWLDYTPTDKQTYDKQFSTEESFHNAVNGCYNLLSSSTLYGKNLSYGAIEAMGNCYRIPTGISQMQEFATATYSGSVASATFSSIWSSAYRAILSMNLALEAVDKHPDVLRPNDAAMIKGELLALRAFVHLDLVRMFGPSISRSGALESPTVPYADNAEIVRRDRLTLKSIIYDKIIPDLTKAQEFLKTSDPVLTDGRLSTTVDGVSNWNRYRQLRMNYYAATVVKARAYLWVKDYDNAYAEAIKIADDSKVASDFPWVEPATLLGNRTNPDRVFSTECFYGFYVSPMSDIYDYNFAGTLSEGVQLYPGKGYLATLFPNIGDYRYQSQWVTSASTVADMDFVKYKSFTTSTTNPAFEASFYGLIRKSEAFLIAAECKAQAGDVNGALVYLNPLQEARGLEKTAPTATASAIIKEVKCEYCRDMRGEGQIFFLHKRNWQSFNNNKEFDGGFNNDWWDDPSAANRYNVPIPASENN